MQVIKVRGEGMPLRGADPPRNGTLHVRALVEFPSSLSPQALRLAESLSGITLISLSDITPKSWPGKVPLVVVLADNP